MAHDRGAALAPRSRSAPRVVAPRNEVNVALPFGRITAEKPTNMKAGDWISLAGLVVSAVGFSVVIRELIRIAHASETGEVSHLVGRGNADSLAGGSSSPDARDRIART